MEIEAKFAVPDSATFQRLIQVEGLAGFLLTPARRKQLHDLYLDTTAGAFLCCGYACRVREDDEGRLLTLKSLTPARSALHQRQELEVRLPLHAGLDAADWPASDATTLARQLSSGQSLQPLFDLRQERYQRLAARSAGEPPSVELSIDRTVFTAAVESEELGVEAELLPAGDLLSLQAVVDELQQVWGLRPEPISKFERGLAWARPELLLLIHARWLSHERSECGPVSR